MKLKHIRIIISLTIFAMLALYVCLGGIIKAHLNKLETKNNFYDTINNIDGNLLILSDGRKVLLAGAYIPRKEDYNYYTILEDNIKSILLGKRFKFKKILNKGTRYPKHDLVNIYDKNGKCINAELLKSGWAFFDHGFYSGSNYYEKLEREAKKQNLGIWKNKQSLKILFVTSRYWWDFHYPECPEVQKIKPEDRIEYYVWPTPIFYYRDPADCKFCREIEIKFNRPKLFTYSEEDWKKDYQKEVKER